MLLLDSFEHLKQNPKRGVHKNEYRFCVSCSYMRALECILDRGRVVCTVHTDIDIEVCDVTVHRQRERVWFFFFFFFPPWRGRAGGLGLYAFCIDMLFCLVFLCYKCLKKSANKKWISFSRLCLVNSWCLEASHDPLPPKYARLSVQFDLFFPSTFRVCFTPLIRRLLWTPVAGHS